MRAEFKWGGTQKAKTSEPPYLLYISCTLYEENDDYKLNINYIQLYLYNDINSDHIYYFNMNLVRIYYRHMN